MTRVVVDDALLGQLGGGLKTVELCTASGLSLGHFVPAFKPHPEDNCPYSAEELAEMRADEGGRTLAEIWKELGVK